MKGPETEKSHKHRLLSGFYNTYMLGNGLDIGYKGSIKDALPVFTTAIGVDQDYPNYNGTILPFADQSQNYVFASHVLEHIENPFASIREWFRVLRMHGNLVICVPHMYLYEKKILKPSLYNEDHKRFYTPSSLMKEIESALTPNSWRLRHLKDNDRDFDYTIIPEIHSSGCYEIECVIQKIESPIWKIE